MHDNCKICKYMEIFTNEGLGESTILYICTLEPYEEDGEFGIVTWLDVKDFKSDRCMNFKER